MSAATPREGESLAELFPEVASEWHPSLNGDLNPHGIKPFSQRKVWWQCKKHSDHVFDAAIGNRVQGRGCPICSGKRILIGFNDLASVRPDIASQWHSTKNGDLTPSDVTAGAGRKVWWQCPIASDHEWQVSVDMRTNKESGTGCPICAGRIVVDSTCLSTLFPVVASQWHPTKNVDITPRDVSPFVTKKAWWVCEEGHEWHAAISSRTSGKTNCPFCAGKLAIVGESDLQTTHPHIAAEWHPLKNDGLLPTDVKAGTNKNVWWQCKDGHAWSVSPSSRCSTNSGCPYCAGQKAIVGQNDLETTHPEISAQWSKTKNESLSPRDIMAGTSRKVWWTCPLGHDWAAPPYSRINLQTGCPICANKQVLAGFNDLATSDPSLASEWHPTKNIALTASQVTRSSGKKVWWVCEEGHEWPSTVANRSFGQGCPICARSGFNPGKDGWLYFLHHPEWAMFQIGISNVPDERLARHKQKGWEVIEVRGPMKGDLTAYLERDALDALSKRGADLGRRGSKSKFDGYTEAWSMDSLNLSNIQELLEWIYEDESDNNLDEMST